jgi:L-fuconolactonase
VGAHDSEAFAQWRKDIAALAALPQVCCKFSGSGARRRRRRTTDVDAAVRRAPGLGRAAATASAPRA